MHTSVSFQALQKHPFPHHAQPQVFQWEHHTVTNGSVFYHYHPEFELSLLRTACARRVIGDDTQEVSGSELLLLGPNLPHRWEAVDADDRPVPAEFWVVAFTRESLGGDLLSRAEMGAVGGLLTRAERGLSFSPPTTNAVADRIVGLDAADGAARLAEFMRVLDVLTRDRGAQPIVSDAYASSGRQADYRLVAALVERFGPGGADAGTDGALISRAAAFARMSVSTFTRFFKRMTGQSFVAHLIELRINRACALLSHTDLPIVEVAHESGFANLSNFNRQFLKATGVSPRGYRTAGRPTAPR